MIVNTNNNTQQLKDLVKIPRKKKSDHVHPLVCTHSRHAHTRMRCTQLHDCTAVWEDRSQLDGTEIDTSIEFSDEILAP